MAWVEVGTKSSSNTWGSAPPIKINWTITAYRDDETNNLKINGTISAVYVSGYFGYNITWGSWVIGESNMRSGTLKGNLPNTWTTVSASQEWNLGNDQSTSILCSAGCASNSGRDAIYLSTVLPTPLIVQEEEEEEEITDIFGEEITGTFVNGIQLQDGPQNIYPVPYFPIGAIYMSTNSTSPASLVGGTWTQLEDRFLLSAGSSYALGSTGGADTVALTVNTMPSHRHGINAYYGNGPTGNFHSRGDGTTTVSVITAAAGSSTVTPHNNMPPYLVVYMWRRTS